MWWTGHLAGTGSDLMAYIDAAFAKTAERTASGQIPDDDVAAED
jgi:hypothetical protein